MRCGSVIALDKSHSGSGNPYWETSRLRPDIVLMDLVTLMHPGEFDDLECSRFPVPLLATEQLSYPFLRQYIRS